VGLAGPRQRDVHTLSGGERQRLAIATLLTQDAAARTCSTNRSPHLDLNHQIAVLELLSRRAREAGIGMVMVLHDINLALRHADRALLLFGDGSRSAGRSPRCSTRRVAVAPLRPSAAPHSPTASGDYFIPGVKP
jgi:iron complex transport system ATP-binding protein